MGYRISCFLPCYNEVGNLAAVVRDAAAALSALAAVYEVIIVDDGSTDGTGDLARALSRESPFVRVVHHESNRGYGGAVISGIRAARLDYVFFTDGDGQFRVEDLRHLLPLLSKADCVVGYRIDRQDSPFRRFAGSAWSLLMDLLLRLRVKDVDCAFKIFRRSDLEEIPLRAQGAMVSAEILARLRRRGISIAEVGVRHHPRTAGECTGGNLRVILKAFRELLALWGSLRGP